MSARIFAPLVSRERLLQPNPIFNGFWASRFRGRIRIIKESLLIPKGSPIGRYVSYCRHDPYQEIGTARSVTTTSLHATQNAGSVELPTPMAAPLHIEWPCILTRLR